MRRKTRALAGVLLTGLAAGCAREHTIEKAARPVKVQAAQMVATQPRLRYSANIEPREQVALAFRVSGYVSEVRQTRGADGRMRNFQEGDAVTRGTVLARVREDDYRETVNRARAGLARAEVSMGKSQLDYERAKRLFDAESLTKPDYEAAKAAFDAATAQAAEARAALAEAEVHLRDTALVAPMDGVLMGRTIEVGSLVGPGVAAFMIADTTSVKAVFGVPDALMQRARPGITIPVTTETYGRREFAGKITSIAPAADPSSRVFEVELTIVNSGNLLKPGMIATAEVPEADPAATREQAEALVVPLAAIVKPGPTGQFGVFVVETVGGKSVVKLRAIEIGEVYGNMIVVRKGVQRGERVVVTGAALLTDTEAVEIIP